MDAFRDGQVAQLKSGLTMGINDDQMLVLMIDLLVGSKTNRLVKM